MNKFFGIGRLTKDPEIMHKGETNIARYSLAIDRRKGEADFINCVCFGRAADFAEKYLQKGMKIAVAGRIQTGSYKTKDGRTVYTTDIVVEEHEFCEGRKPQEEAKQSAVDTFTTNTSSGSPRGSQDASRLDGFLSLDGYSEEEAELPFI